MPDGRVLKEQWVDHEHVQAHALDIGAVAQALLERLEDQVHGMGGGVFRQA
ncbi:hypothetical protein D3C73_1447120 [compost metagenome]